MLTSAQVLSADNSISMRYGNIMNMYAAIAIIDHLQ